MDNRTGQPFPRRLLALPKQAIFGHRCCWSSSGHSAHSFEAAICLYRHSLGFRIGFIVLVQLYYAITRRHEGSQHSEEE